MLWYSFVRTFCARYRYITLLPFQPEAQKNYISHPPTAFIVLDYSNESSSRPNRSTRREKLISFHYENLLLSNLFSAILALWKNYNIPEAEVAEKSGQGSKRTVRFQENFGPFFAENRSNGTAVLNQSSCSGHELSKRWSQVRRKSHFPRHTIHRNSEFALQNISKW